MKTELKHISRPIISIVFMRKNFLKLGAALLLSGSAVLSVAAQSANMVALSGHVPAIVAHLKAEGLLPTTNNLTLSIGLPLRNTGALSNLLQEMYNPASTNFHKYLTTEQFTAQFGPTEQDYQAVINFAKANGLLVTGTHPNRMLLNVTGKVSDVQNAFHVTLHEYQHPTEARGFYAPDVEPSVPSTVPVKDIGGLDNYRQPYAKFKFKPTSKTSGATPKVTSGSTTTSTGTPKIGSGADGSYIGDDFRNAYVPGTKLDGSGQSVALVQFDGYLASDIALYETMAGRTNIPLKNVLIDGFNGSPTGSGGEVEVSLDIEMLVSMAPALQQIILYEGNPFNFFPNDVLNRIATDNSARQISCSWGWTGGPNGTTDQIFQQMALQGQTFFDAVGDSDAFTAGANSVNGVDNPNIPNAPSDSPYITQVGGTTLSTAGPGGAYTSETVWNWDIEFGPGADGIGSSGGISSFYSIPTWQTNINFTASQGSTTFRNTPDVALTADNVLVIADGGISYPGTGGTSCASPLWAGYAALINQQATNNGHGAIGFINPALYAIAAGTNYTNCFHDITTGNNTWSGSPALFPAVTGYDLATGLGSPNGTNLINALTATGVTNPITHISAPLPPYGSTLSALNGGNPNGTWTLFVQDDTKPDTGVISNGWSITLTMASPVGSAADSAVAMTPAASFIPVGANAVYFITVTNYGPTASTNIIVSDSLPSGATFVSATTTQGSAIRNGASVIWNLGSLTNGAGAQLTLTLHATVAGNLENDAIVSSDTSDPNPDDNLATTTVVVGTVTPPQLSGSLSGTGGAFQFTVTGQSGQSYIIQASTNLVNWAPIFTNQSPYASPFTFVDPNATNYVNRFYRVVTGP